MKELVFKRQHELEDIYKGVHMDVDTDAARQILTSLIESGYCFHYDLLPHYAFSLDSEFSFCSMFVDLLRKSVTKHELFMGDTLSDMLSDYSSKMWFTGNVDLSDLLSSMDDQIAKARQDALSRKDILEKVEKWKHASEEEKWLDEYEKVNIINYLNVFSSIIFIS